MPAAGYDNVSIEDDIRRVDFSRFVAIEPDNRSVWDGGGRDVLQPCPAPRHSSRSNWFEV